MIISISGYAGSGKDTAGKIIQYLVYCSTIKSSPTYEQYLQVKDGRAVSGKAAEWQIKKWADPLRKVAAIMLGMDVNFLYTDEFKSMYLPSCWNYTRQTFECDEHNRDGFTEASMTGREFLQKLGTDAVRDNLHENAWVNALMSEYKPKHSEGYIKGRKGNHIYYGEAPNWIITDTRFPNELAAVKERGGISIRINRDLYLTLSSDTVVRVMHNPQFDGYHPSETALDKAKFDYVIDNNGTIEELVEKLKTILVERNIIQPL